MSLDKKLTELTKITEAQSTNLIYVVVEENGIPVSKGITVYDFLKSQPTGDNRIISGSVLWTGTSYTFESVNLSYEINGLLYTSNLETVTLDVPDPTNPRIDIIYVDANGLNFKTGIPSATPIEPNLDDPLSEIKASIVLVQNGTTVPSEITDTTVYEENTQIAGGEWNTSENTAGLRFNLGSTFEPLFGLVDIKTIANLQNTDSVTFDYDTTNITVADFNGIRFSIKSFQDWNNDRFILRFKQDGVPAGKGYINSTMLETDNPLVINLVYITTDQITWNGPTFNEVVLEAESSQGGIFQTDINVQIDNIVIQTGGTIIPPSGNLTALEVSYDNSDSTLVATNVKTAIDALSALIDATSGVIIDDGSPTEPAVVNGSFWYQPTTGIMSLGVDDFWINPFENILSATTGTTAVSTTYDNTDSGLTATNVKGAIDELEGLDALKALKTNVLELDNTTVFIPDTDYEPATKKYVDDNAGDFIPTNQTWSFIYTSNNWSIYSNTGQSSSIGVCGPTNAGLISSSTQTIYGAKTFDSAVTAPDFIGSSDKRLKENIKELKVKEIKSAYKTGNFIGNKQERVFVIAQELEEKHPEFVRTDKEGMKSVSYTDLHSAEIAYLKQEIEKLKNIINKLKI